MNDPTSKGNRESKVLAAVYVYIRMKKHFEGSATELIRELKSVSSEVFYPNRITRDLFEEGHKLIDYGILFATKRDREKRIIILHYLEDDKDEPTVTKAPHNRKMLAI